MLTCAALKDYQTPARDCGGASGPAIAAYTEAIKLDPRLRPGLRQLGRSGVQVSLRGTGSPAEAAASA